MNNIIDVDILVVGAGPAGLAAAISAKKAGIDSIVVIEREASMGGILQQCIHNGFGLHRHNVELTGPEYAQIDIDEFVSMGIEIKTECTVLEISKDKLVSCISKSDGMLQYRAKAIILAMGCRERPRGALAIPGSRCSGVFTAGTAQKFLNIEGFLPGKNVVILGSGDIGLIMARRMTLQGAKVHACVEIMPYSSGLNRNIVQCLDDFNIPLYLSHTVIDIIGRDRVEAVKIAKVDENRKPIPGSEFIIKCDTLLLSVGLIPENELSKNVGIELTQSTFGPVVDEKFQTNVEGIFACGNVLHVHDLVDFVSKEAMLTGIAAANYVKNGVEEASTILVKDGSGVRGCVPQKISCNCAEDVDIMFRPTQVFKNSQITVYNGENKLFLQKKLILTPGEMVVIKLKSEAINNIDESKNITVCIE